MPIKLDQIEGATPLDPDEIEGLIPSYISTQGQLNAAEQANIADGRAWALGKKHKSVLDDLFLRELHKRMFKDVWRWAGTYRKKEKNIGEDPKHISVKVLELCRNTEHWIQVNAFAWDEIAVRFHHALVFIHPFPNGNGRHSRLATDVLMQTHGQKSFTWGSDKADFRQTYLQALRAADKDDFKQLLAFVRS